jgi:hypothetical protein
VRQERTYTREEDEAMVHLVQANDGYVAPTAVQLGVPRKTLEYKVKRSEALAALTHVATHEEVKAQAAIRAVAKAENAEKFATEPANGAEIRRNTVLELADAFLELAHAATAVARAKIGDASPYHAALISAISLDKWALITGRPTSRSEVHSFRYVEPDALRSLAAKVVDVTPAHLTANQGSALPPPKARKHRRKRRFPAQDE